MMRQGIGLFLIAAGLLGLSIVLVDWSLLPPAPKQAPRVEPAPSEPADAATAPPPAPNDPLPTHEEEVGQPAADRPPTPQVPDPAGPAAEEPDAMPPESAGRTAPKPSSPKPQPEASTGDLHDETVAPPVPEPPLPDFEDVQITQINVDLPTQDATEGTHDAVVKVRLGAPTIRPIVVVFATFDNTAKEERDYRPQRGTLMFEPGQIEAEIVVLTLDDREKEAAEQFELHLTADPTVATLESRKITLTIQDND